jgi:hypothetical protein
MIRRPLYKGPKGIDRGPIETSGEVVLSFTMAADFHGGSFHAANKALATEGKPWSDGNSSKLFVA